jgi:hypothetical protein
MTERARKHVLFEEDGPLESIVMLRSADIPEHLHLESVEFDKDRTFKELTASISHVATQEALSTHESPSASHVVKE